MKSMHHSLLPFCAIAVFAGAFVCDAAGTSLTAMAESYELRCVETDETVQVLELSETRRSSAVVRLLLVSPGGRPVVLTRTISPRTGEITTRIRDDRTGWTSQVTKHYEVTGPTMDAFLEAIDQAGLTTDQPIPMRFSSHGGGVAEAVVVDTSEGYDHLLARLRDGSVGPAVRGEIPAGFDEALSFLDEAVVRDPLAVIEGRESKGLGFIWRPNVQLLMGILRGEKEAPSARNTWTREKYRFEVGSPVARPEFLEFVSAFRSIENTDPLSDLRQLEEGEQEP